MTSLREERKKMESDGGPAFPLRFNGVVYKGITKREWFAGQALAGMASDNYIRHAAKDMADPSDLARIVYGIADAMLAERSKE